MASGPTIDATPEPGAVGGPANVSWTNAPAGSRIVAYELGLDDEILTHILPLATPSGNRLAWFTYSFPSHTSFILNNRGRVLATDYVAVT